jgi:hypothetical protein
MAAFADAHATLGQEFESTFEAPSSTSHFDPHA